MVGKTKLTFRRIDDAAGPEDHEHVSPVAADLADTRRSTNLRAANSSAAEPFLSVESSFSPTVGDVLRSERLERDLSLRDISQQLRIQVSYLQALEEGAFDNLPGPTYAVGYVRSYATLMDLDPNRLIADFKAEAKKLQEPSQLAFPSPAPEGKVPGGALVFAGMVVAAISYGGWYFFSTSEIAISDLTPGIPDRLSFLLEEPAIRAPGATESANTSSQSAAPVAAPSAPVAHKEASVPVQAVSEGDSLSAGARAEVEPEPTNEAELDSGDAPLGQEPNKLSEILEAPVETGETEVPVPQTATSLERTSTASRPISIRPAPRTTPVEIPAAPAISALNAATEPAPDAAVPPDTGISESAQTVVQVASLPEPASDSLSRISDIPAAPDVADQEENVADQEETGASRSVAEAEAASIDSKPRPVSDVAKPLIVISATDDSWVQIRNTDSAALLTRILRKGEQYKVPARPGLKLFTGNAGALKISVNGEEVPSLGPFGKIARNIPLDETLLTHTAVD